jgi:hypothetical protein
MTKFFHQLRLLLWKNFIIKKRSLVSRNLKVPVQTHTEKKFELHELDSHFQVIEL